MNSNDVPSAVVEERCKLIAKALSFYPFSPSEVAELAKVAEDCYFKTGDVIVKQGEVVDCVYIIVEGRAEVTKSSESDKQEKPFPVCVLDKNESIGLAKTGFFFSTTGLRVATVTALTDLHALRLGVDNLHSFIKKHPPDDEEMLRISEQILYMNFIKRVAPFARLTSENIHVLATNIKKKNYAAGEVIFYQGDLGDSCYLVALGLVEIVLTNAKGEEEVVASLDTQELFGELALLTDAPRNATARAAQPSVLLSIDRELLNKLFWDEEKARNDIFGVMLERQRPVKKEYITVFKHHNADGELIITLKNSINRNYFRLSPQGLFVWEKLDGDHSIQAISLAFFKEFRQFSQDAICSLIVRLAYDGFVDLATVRLTEQMQNSSWWVRKLTRLKQIMEYRVSLSNSDEILTKWYNNGVHWIYTWPVQTFCILLVIIGMIAFLTFATHVSSLLQDIRHVWLLFVYFLIADLLVIPLHELGHAFTTKYFGREVHQYGVGWFWMGPIAYADTSDMWLAKKWPRVAVNAAGLYVNAIFSGIAALLAYLWSNPHLGVFLWLYAATSYYNILVNLNPTIELDGYYILMDVLDKPNLRESAILWLINDFPAALKSPKLFLQHKAELCYWIVMVLYLILIMYVAYLFQVYILQYLFPASVGSQFNNVLRWLLPIIVIGLSSAGIVAEIRQKAYKAQS
jgi:putative peptide zinc metalloprotease protein